LIKHGGHLDDTYFTNRKEIQVKTKTTILFIISFLASGVASAQVMTKLTFEQDLQMLGWDVDISGDYLITGAPWKSTTNKKRMGAGYVYHKDGANNWSTGVTLTKTTDLANDQFGYAVAIDGDYIAIGGKNANGGSTGTSRQAGVVRIYHRTGVNSWDEGTTIMARDGQPDEQFGCAVDISGDYLVVGTCLDRDTLPNSGTAYVYHRTGTNSWDSEFILKAVDAEAGDMFGNAVAIDGDYIVIGASREDGSGKNRGAAYVFRRTGTNTWDAGTKLTASGAGDEDRFGNAVAIAGDYLAIGAVAENSYTGAAYVFHRTGSNTWDTGTKIAGSGDLFGYSVAIGSDKLVVGAFDDDTTAKDAGAVYLFNRTGTNTWDAGTKVVANDGQSKDRFGKSVAISGTNYVVGSYLENERGHHAGAVYVVSP
jgi:hypothetical protein